MGNEKTPPKDAMTHATLVQVRGRPDEYYCDPAGTQESDATPDSLTEQGFFEVADEPVSDPRYPNVVRRLTYARINTPGEEPVSGGVG